MLFTDSVNVKLISFLEKSTAPKITCKTEK